MEEIEKIDLIRSRLNIGYREAREALEAAGGDVVQALINLEEKESDFSEKVHHRGQELMAEFKEILRKGQGTKIKVKQGDKTVFEIPASMGALGLLGVLAKSELAVLGALGTVAAMSKKYTLEFEKTGPSHESGDNSQDPTPGRV